MVGRSFHSYGIGWEAIPKVREWLGCLPGGPLVFGRPSSCLELVGRLSVMSGSGWELLQSSGSGYESS